MNLTLIFRTNFKLLKLVFKNLKNDYFIKVYKRYNANGFILNEIQNSKRTFCNGA